ncbi:intracellular protease/amidase [Streptomyces sp. C]|nr:intracellular protease/amidase [Streptomyces sp. C]
MVRANRIEHEEVDSVRIAFLTALEGVEEVELTAPWKAVEGAGWNPQLVSTEAGQVQAFDHLDRAGRFTVDHVLAGDTADAFDALVLPGGVFLSRRPADGRAGRRLHQELLHPGEAGRRDLPRPVDPGRGRRRAGPDPDLVAEPGHRHPQRRRHLGGRAGTGLPGGAVDAGHQPQAGRPGRLLRRRAP